MAQWRIMSPIRPVRMLGDGFRRRVTRAISGVPLSTVVAGCIGIFIGLAAAALIAVPLSFLLRPGRRLAPVAGVDAHGDPGHGHNGAGDAPLGAGEGGVQDVGQGTRRLHSRGPGLNPDPSARRE